MAAAKKYFEQKSLPGTTAHEIRLVCGNSTQTVTLTGHTIGRTIAEAQSFSSIHGRHGGKIDYIHDDDTAARWLRVNGCAGLLLPPMNKNELFQSIMEAAFFRKELFHRPRQRQEVLSRVPENQIDKAQPPNPDVLLRRGFCISAGQAKYNLSGR
jgi:hypothetical protein